MTTRAEKVAAALRTAGHCHGLVVRDGEEDACGKPPVTLVDGTAWDDGYWPACAYHAHRYGRRRCVTLADLLAALTDPEPTP